MNSGTGLRSSNGYLGSGCIAVRLSRFRCTGTGTNTGQSGDGKGRYEHQEQRCAQPSTCHRFRDHRQTSISHPAYYFNGGCIAIVCSRTVEGYVHGVAQWREFCSCSSYKPAPLRSRLSSCSQQFPSFEVGEPRTLVSGFLFQPRLLHVNPADPRPSVAHAFSSFFACSSPVPGHRPHG